MNYKAGKEKPHINLRNETVYIFLQILCVCESGCLYFTKLKL